MRFPIGTLAAAVAFGAAMLPSAAAQGPSPRPGSPESPPPPQVRWSAEHRARVNSSPFAINGTKIFHIPDEIETTVPRRLGWMKELGVYWDRADLWWHVVEPEPGRFDFTRSDRAFATFEAAGVQWYPILAYGAAWFPPGANGPATDEQVAAFANYVETTVRRYRGRAPVWSMWNEPNIPNFWTPNPNADHYTRLMKASREALRRADPRAKLAAPVLAPIGTWDRRFTERILQLGGGRYFEIFDYHYYRGNPEPEVPMELAEIRAVLWRYGFEKPIWLTEMGVGSIPSSDMEAQRRQASLVIRNHLLCLGLGVERIFYFDLQNWYDDKPDEWDSQLGLVTADGQKKRSFYAYRHMVERLEGSDFVGMIGNGERGVFQVLARDRRTGELTLAAWKWTGGEEDLTLQRGPRFRANFHSSTAEASDMLGENAVGRPTVDGRGVTVKIGLDPVYVRGVAPEVYLPRAGVRFERPLTILAPGERTPLRLFVHPTLRRGQARVEVSRTDLPSGVRWDADGQTLRVDGNATPGRKRIRAQVAVDFQGLRQTVPIEAHVDVVPTVNVRFRPTTEDGNVIGRVLLENQTSRRIGSEVRLESAFTPEVQNYATSDRITLTGGQNVHVDLALPKPDRESFYRATFAGNASRPVGITVVKLSDSGPDIDGDLSDWEGLPAMTLNEVRQLVAPSPGWTPDRASAVAHVWLTPTTLYLAADVRDQGPINTEEARLMWRQDSLEFYIGFAGPTGRTVLDKAVEFQIGVAPVLANRGATVFWFHEDNILDTARVATRNTPTGWTVEAAIPLDALRLDPSRFGGIRDGMVIGLDVKLNDYDAGDWAPLGNVPGRMLVWSGDGMNWIDPARWGIGVVRRMPASP